MRAFSKQHQDLTAKVEAVGIRVGNLIGGTSAPGA
jgi:hypothetical protein